MKIMQNVKCSDFYYKKEWKGSRLKGEENLYVWVIYYKDGRRIDIADTKKEAMRFVSQKVKEMNAILEAARKKYNQ